MSAVAAAASRLYKLLPEAVRSRLRPLKRPSWSIFGAALWRATGGATARGPFKGVRQGPVHFRATLAGTYERELDEWFERLLGPSTASFERAVDVGGGTGYYAAGLALRLPMAQVTVFEIDPAAREVIEDTLRRNDVSSRVTIHGECTIATLADALAGDARTLLVMDVEGAERELLDPVAIPALAHTTIVVETHDVFAPGAHETIKARFAATHAIEERRAARRTMADYPPDLLPRLRRLMPGVALASIDEMRQPPFAWLLLTPRS
jgi:predicted O-methyltransferase YrrM